MFPFPLSLSLFHPTCSSNRDHTVQSVRRQVFGRPLRRHHVRGLQGFLSPVAELRRQLPVSAEQAVRGRSRQSQPMPVLPVTEVPEAGNEP